MANLVSQAEFARNNGWSRSYVTELKHNDRLVMEKRGRKSFVVVDASLDLIAATADQNRDDVKKRWKQSRQSPEKETATAPPEKETDAARDEVKEDKAVMSYQVARALKESYAARQAKMQYEKEIGKLVDEADVRRAFAAQWNQLRISMDHLRDQIAAELAGEDDVDAIHALLGEHFENLQSELCRKLGALAGKEA